MRETVRSCRGRAAVAGATAAALVLVGALAGCEGAGDQGSGRQASAAGGRPSPKPTPRWDPSPGSIAAVGDSITRGFDACSVLSDCPEASWATGTDAQVRSLASRLLGDSVVSTRSWNYARTGARMADLAAQMKIAVENRPELVTVMVGANDACRDSVAAMTPVADFRAGFEAAMKALRGELPKAQVYVTSVPDLKRLWSQGRGNPLGKQIWKLGICRSMLGDAEATDGAAGARRDAVQQRVMEYNQALGDMCRKDLYCRYDGGAVFAYRFTGEQLSHWDWFHPSKNGQNRLAEMAYRNVTAAEPPA
ncbi:SGNH/GDSL hydrolase family protein [Streptomyces sp. A3M-1-3]|uniref:SGNH/GDSL hydrolase family protein n=1 Tax=Streptomyces sp. A3M-1-3 TaxID=2962044 RepID=UPI0020B70D53|nr:SGNH/GDSL hydrolase family protein [Streptomyces sp. A3M-1-3]MCP3821212.1 SGNH/GDSL hydrolase family protein [Streptomyces sp. A3M-1-3]